MKRYFPLLHGTPTAWDVQRKPHKDGGGSYYKNAERLYGVQADTAEFMLGLGKGQLPGAVDAYASAAKEFSDPAFADRMAGQAGADAQQAIGQNTAAMGRNLARYGINPNSGRFAAMAGDNAIRGAALQTGAMNNARKYVQDKRFGVAKDFYSSLVGINSDAASQAGQAGGNFMQMGNQMQAKQDNEDAAWGSAIGMGAAYKFKDGGEIKVGRRMATGGLFGAANGMPAIPSQTRPQRGGIAQGIQAGKKLKAAASMKPNATIAGMADMGNVSGAGMAGAEAGLGGNTATAGILGQEAGMGGVGAGGMSEGTAASLLGDDVAATIAAQDAAVTGTAGLAAETTAALGAAETATAGTAGMTGAMAGAAAAAPWLAAGVGVASLLGLFADGGEVKLADGGDAKKSNKAKNSRARNWTPQQIEEMVRERAIELKMDPNLAVAVARKESSMNPRARNATSGASGVMQMIPSTAKMMGVKDIWDPKQNVDGGLRYLKKQLDTHGGDVALALAAYNAGPGKVRQYGGVPPFPETHDYIRTIAPDVELPQLRRSTVLKNPPSKAVARPLPPVREGAMTANTAMPAIATGRSMDIARTMNQIQTPKPTTSPLLAHAIVDQRNIERGASPMLQPALDAAPQWERANPAYTIQKGDTLSKIAAKFGTTVEKLAADNGITDKDMIIAGKTLQYAEGGEVQPATLEQYFDQKGWKVGPTEKGKIYETLTGKKYKGTQQEDQYLLQIMVEDDQWERSDTIPEGERVQMQKGGDVQGAGTETSDDIPAWLSDGEYVVNAEAVKMPGVKRTLETINAAGLAKRYGVM
jgi:LysM repeat protein